MGCRGFNQSRPNVLMRSVNQKGKTMSYIRLVSHLSWPMLHPSAKFHENQVSSFYVILLTNKPTNRTEKITSSAKVIKKFVEDCHTPSFAVV